jgi:hypothetical protein
MAYGLLIGEDELVALWAFETFKIYKAPVNQAIGIVTTEGKIVGAAIFQNFNGSNVELSYYGPKTLTLGIVRALAKATIATFNASRLTVVTSQRNRLFMRGLQKIGFKLEGHQRCYYGREDNKRNNGIRFVLFRDGLEKLSKCQCSSHPHPVSKALAPITKP